MIVSSRLLVGKEYLDYPQMSSQKIVDAVLEHLPNDFRFFAVNFANSDMIAHTGNIKATVSALKTIDQSLEKIVSAAIKDKIAVVITADHGNADAMVDPSSSQPNTFHTKNPVPFLLASDKFKNKKIASGGVLGNIAPTILEMMEIEKPKVMNKNSLIK